MYAAASWTVYSPNERERECERGTSRAIRKAGEKLSGPDRGLFISERDEQGFRSA